MVRWLVSFTHLVRNKMTLGICIVPTRAYPALPGSFRPWEQSALPREHNRQATTLCAHVLLPLAVNKKSAWKVYSLLPLGFEHATFSMLAHLSDC
jgi:hypothetical protein